MSTDSFAALGLLAAALAMFAWGRWRYDLVAIATLVAGVAIGLVPAARAFDGFSHPAVITVAAVLALSRGLRNAGLTNLVGRALDPLSASPTLHCFSLTAAVAALSSFMNNVAALSLMLPVAIASAERRGRPAGLVLMPLAFGSLLGGLVTLIGTPPNLIVSAYREDLVGRRFELLDFSAAGLGVAIAGVLFVGLVGWRLVPVRERAGAASDNPFAVDDYVTELRIVGDRAPAGTRYGAFRATAPAGVEILALWSGGVRIAAPDDERILAGGDIVLVHGAAEALHELVRRTGMTLAERKRAGPKRAALAEAVVTSGSPLVGRRLRAIAASVGAAARVIGLARPRGDAREWLRDARLRVGDVILVEGDPARMHAVLATLGLLPLADRVLPLGTRARPGFALAVFLGAVALGASDWLSLPVALAAAVVVYAVTGVVRPGELYRSIEWPVVVLLGAFIPVGESLHRAGATDLIAAGILAIAGGLPIAGVLAVLLVATMLITDVLNNATAALVMAPIAASLAAALGASPDPFLMVVAIGASCTFLTPVGHQSNTLVMGPGGYRFGDYWRMGLPLQAVVVVAAVPLVMWAWPPG